MASGTGAASILKPFQGSSGLADFDEMAVGVPQIGADLPLVMDWRSEKLRATCCPRLVYRLDVRHAEVDRAVGSLRVFRRVLSISEMGHF